MTFDRVADILAYGIGKGSQVWCAFSGAPLFRPFALESNSNGGYVLLHGSVAVS